MAKRIKMTEENIRRVANARCVAFGADPDSVHAGTARWESFRNKAKQQIAGFNACMGIIDGE